MEHLIELKPFMTRPPDSATVNNIAMMVGQEKDAITGLSGVTTQFGRPNWVKEFTNIAEEPDNKG